ncbi:hypothetical protein BDR22DRAFT_812987, partial [Usnea florida]
INTLAGVPFGFSVVLVTISSTNYLVDSYTGFAALALTICIYARAICGAYFHLFVRYTFAHLGIYWGLSIPAFLVLFYAPFPFIFRHCGPSIRARCKSEHAEKSLQ